MKNNPISPELRTLAFVGRWNILMAGNRDNVAQHSYYVTVYSRVIADVIQWKGPMDYVMWQALMHDADEAITGDIIGPAKKQIIDEEKAADFLNDQMEAKMGGLIDLAEHMEVTDVQHDEATRIVHAADKLDALLYLIGEHRMGNRVVEYCIQHGTRAVEGAWRNLPATKETLDITWQTVILPSISDHYNEGGRGI